MATELETPVDSSLLCLERGRKLLVVLKRAAHAARLEAQVAELQSALSEAQSGAGQRLQRWLKDFETLCDCPPDALLKTECDVSLEAAATAITGAAATTGATAAAVAAISGWSVYLPHAEHRLRQLADSKPQLAEPLEDCLAAPATEDEPRLELQPEPDQAEIPDAIPESVLASVLDGAAPATAIEHASPTINRPMMSGMSLSLAGHSLLLLALFMITYKLPRESASLGSQIQSVTAVTENVEVSQPFQLPEPMALELPEITAPSAGQSAPTALSDFSASSLETALDGIAHHAVSSGASSAAAALMSAGGRSGQGQGAGGSGGPAISKVGGKFFGVGSGGNFFCYVVDSSGSMRGGAWESAKAELVRSLTTLTERQSFYIVFFAKEFSAIPEPGQREPAAHGLLATPQNIDHARRWIETIKIDRGGPPNDALEWAIERDPDAIYLLTDGVTKTDVCGFLREKNRVHDFLNDEQVRVPIHTIAYQSLDGQQLLRQLAEENKGQFHYVPSTNAKR